MAYLRVVLDKPTYAVGEPIRGRVEVENDKDCKCTALHVWARWHTHGRGNTARGEAEKVELFQGMWTAGDHPSYPFQLPPLQGPLTYHGTELNVDWEVHATADVPWAIDPKTDTPLTLVRGAAPPESVNQLTVPVVGQQAALEKALVPVAGCLLLFFVLPGVGTAGAGVLMLAGGNPEGLFLVPFGLVFAGIAFLFLFLMFKNKIAGRKLGKVDVAVQPRTVTGGSAVHVSLSFCPQADLDVNAITATLVGKEEVVRGAGTDKKTYTHELYKEVIELRGKESIRQGRDMQLSTTVTVPADAAPSFAASDNRLLWSLVVDIDIEGWPDWSHDEPLTVLPA